jgi:CRISPR/Cas system CSM-associated protein Csm4 (group 5 of RAMP superfamily)
MSNNVKNGDGCCPIPQTEKRIEPTGIYNNPERKAILSTADDFKDLSNQQSKFNKGINIPYISPDQLKALTREEDLETQVAKMIKANQVQTDKISFLEKELASEQKKNVKLKELINTLLEKYTNS